MHPVLLQKVHEGAHFRQQQAVAQGQDAHGVAAADRPRAQS
jgi:hypothetical protein